jgi:hypothetical protein
MISIFIFLEYKTRLSHLTITQYWKILGLDWVPVKTKRQNILKYPTNLLYDFLIKLDFYVWQINVDPENCPDILVSFDETHINKNHVSTHTCLCENSAEVDRSTSRGERAVILHAITPEGPLCELKDGYPIDNLEWNRKDDVKYIQILMTTERWNLLQMDTFDILKQMKMVG